MKQQSGRKNELPSFQGSWDSGRAQALAMARLRKAQTSDEYKLCYRKNCAMHHTFLNEFRLTQRGNEAIVLLSASKPSEEKCKGCAPILSTFKFETSKAGWELRDEGIGFSKWGPYVEADLADITVLPLASDEYGVFLTSKSVSHGHAVSLVHVYVPAQRKPLLARDLYRVLELQTSEENSRAKAGPNHWNATIQTQPGKSRLYDLLITREGIRDGKTFSESERLKFNGERYIPYDWNSSWAQAFVISKIRSESAKETDPYRQDETGDESKPQVTGEYFLAHRNYESMVVLGALINCTGPLACAPPISWFEFQRRKHGWRLVHSEMHFTQSANYWGNPSSRDFELSLIGDDTFGLLLQNGACSTGTCESSTQIYARSKGRFQQVLRLFTDGASFPGGPPGDFYWDFQIRLRPTTTGFYDLAISGLGKRSGDSGTFRFNGVRYISKTWHQNLE